MKIAVITPAYNAQNDIVKCIESVRQQTVKAKICHYIFNDGSTDETHKKIVESGVEFYVNSPDNVGVSKARNHLIDSALQDGCDFIAFLDADDIWLSDHLEACLSGIGDADIAYTHCIHQFEDGAECFRSNIPVPKVFIGKQLMFGNFIYVPCVFAKSKCFASIRFDPEIDGLEDWDLWYRMWEEGMSFVAVDKSTVIHVVNKESMAGTGLSKLASFRKKHKTLNEIKLHLACGSEYREDYINVDLYADAKVDARFDVASLPYEDNSVDEIKAFHIIEHFDWHKGNEVLKEWARVLKPGGKLWLETPDFYESCKQFIQVFEKNDGEGIARMYGHFFSEAWLPGQAHLFLFTEPQLRTQLEWAGFGDIARVPPSSGYLKWHPEQVFLALEATKK